MRVVPLEDIELGGNELSGDDSFFVDLDDLIQPEKGRAMGDDLLDFVTGEGGHALHVSRGID